MESRERSAPPPTRRFDIEPLHPLQIERFRAMTWDEKWTVARGLLKTALHVRRASLQSLHPEWSDKEIQRALASEITRART